MLPEMESSSASASSPAAASSRSAPGRSAASSASSMPLIHQRRQHIISNTPDATNPVQTILQPDLPNPPRLAMTLPIPSIVRMAAAQQAPSLSAPTLTAVVKPAAPPTPAPVPQPTPPKSTRNVDTAHTHLCHRTRRFTEARRLRHQWPHLRAPEAATSASRPLPPSHPLPLSLPTAPPAPPSTATPAGGTDSRNLLVVNSMDVQSTLSEHDIPAAEIHGRFEVTSPVRTSPRSPPPAAPPAPPASPAPASLPPAMAQARAPNCQILRRSRQQAARTATAQAAAPSNIAGLARHGSGPGQRGRASAQATPPAPVWVMAPATLPRAATAPLPSPA